MIRYALLITITFLLFCCKNREVNPDRTNVGDQYPKKVLYTQDSTVGDSRVAPFLRNFARLLELPDISKGTSGLYVRIWIWRSERSYIVNISDAGQRRNCHIVEANSEKIPGGGENIVTHAEWKDLQPKSGWDNFMKGVVKYDIVTMNSGAPYEKIIHIPTHGAYVQFEISQPDSYRLYEYFAPSFYRYVDTGSKKVYDFLALVNEEMGVKAFDLAEKVFLEPGTPYVK